MKKKETMTTQKTRRRQAEASDSFLELEMRAIKREARSEQEEGRERREKEGARREAFVWGLRQVRQGGYTLQPMRAQRLFSTHLHVSVRVPRTVVVQALGRHRCHHHYFIIIILERFESIEGKLLLSGSA
jgi:hypothetical protein